MYAKTRREWKRSKRQSPLYDPEAAEFGKARDAAQAMQAWEAQSYLKLDKGIKRRTSKNSTGRPTPVRG